MKESVLVKLQAVGTKMFLNGFSTEHFWETATVASNKEHLTKNKEHLTKNIWPKFQVNWSILQISQKELEWKSVCGENVWKICALQKIFYVTMEV